MFYIRSLLFFSLLLCSSLLLGVDKEDFIDEQGHPIDPLPIQHFTYEDPCCGSCDKYSWKRNRHAKETFQQATNNLYYYVEPPFQRDEQEDYAWSTRWRRDYRDRMASWTYFYFQRDPRQLSADIHLYSEYAERFNYLYYWLKLCSDLDVKKLKKLYEQSKRELKQIKEKGKASEEYIRYLEEQLEKIKRSITERPQKYNQSIQMLEEELDWISEKSLVVYNRCIARHKSATARFQRGRIYFDRGDILNSFEDLMMLVENGFDDSQQINVLLGQAYNETNLFDHAIKTLTEVIQEHPEHKEAYFERAYAYFETGNFQLALSDYLSSEMHPTLLDPQLAQYIDYFIFYEGFTIGCLKGAADSAVDFAPSLFSTIYGIGKGVWVFASDPVGVSKEVVETCTVCIEYIKENISPELLALIIPELKECLDKWDQLEANEKGHYIGYIIGRYGTDILILGGCTRGIKLVRNIKKASSFMTLELAAKSATNFEELAIASENYYLLRQKYKSKCYLSVKDQEKHIPGTNNFKTKINPSELEISIEELKELTEPLIGNGMPWRYTFGDSGYIEVIDYKKTIGIFVSEDGTKRIPTSIGAIHYNMEGGYHVVPISPTSKRAAKLRE